MRNKKILVIDDEPAIHRLLQIILEDEGFDIVGFEKHEGARQNISKGKPDLIILDIMMPEVDGFDVLRMLKSDDETQEIPVIILTARNKRVDMEKAAALGADSYITKPFQHSELLKAVRSACSTGNTHRR